MPAPILIRGLQATGLYGEIATAGDRKQKDSAAFGAALNLGGGGNLLLRVPPGQFLLDPVVLPPGGSNLIVQGSGKNITTVIGAPTTAFTGIFTVQGAAAAKLSHVEFADLTIDCANVANAAAIMHYYVSNLKFRRVRFQNSSFKFFQSLVAAQTTIDNDHIEFLDCEFAAHTGANEALTIANTDYVAFEDCQWSACSFGVLLYQLVNHATFRDPEFMDISGNALVYSLSCNDIGLTRPRVLRCGGGIQGANQSDHGAFGYLFVDGLWVRDLFAKGSAVSAGSALQVGAVQNFEIDGFAIEDLQNQAMDLSAGNAPVSYPSRHGSIRGGECRNNNQSNTVPGLHAGLLIGSAMASNLDLDIKLKDLEFYDDQGVPTQAYGISMDGGVMADKRFNGLLIEGGGGNMANPIGLLSGATLGKRSFVRDFEGYNPMGAVTATTKAGVPVDGDFDITPPDGTMVADTTNNKLWVRVGGAWKGVVVA